MTIYSDKLAGKRIAVVGGTSGYVYMVALIWLADCFVVLDLVQLKFYLMQERKSSLFPLTNKECKVQ